jgi:hypothetical protein
VRSGAIGWLGYLAQPLSIYDLLRARSETLYRRSVDLEPIRTQLRELRPDLLWSTVAVSYLEAPYVLAARDLSIPTVTSVLSFDNLSSRWPHFQYDHYLVWSESMAAQLLRYHPGLDSDRISVTGTPQFDFHRRSEFRWSRTQTLERLGLPGDARYFLYAASHVSLAPDEPRLVAQLAQRMGRDPIMTNIHLVIRLHPLEDWERWSSLSSDRERVILSPAWDTPPDRDGWTLASPEDQARLVSTIAHAEACVNIASTMSLDAAILDRPVIGIDFRTEPESPQEILYEEYQAEHYHSLVESGGLRLARSWSDLMSLMRRATEIPDEDREQRAAMVRSECGLVDGQAATRVAKAITRLARSRASRTQPELMIP